MRGEYVSIMGRSGSGKTTLLTVMGLLARPDAGSVHVAGVDVTAAPDSALALHRLMHIGFVFQSYSLIPHLSVTDNVALPLRHGPLVRRRDEREAVSRVLDAVGLQTKAGAMPRVLSGGEQQRVAIARALVRKPEVILADEPTGALDVHTGASVMKLMKAATRGHDCSLVVVTHDAEVAAEADRCVIISEGSVHDESFQSGG